MAWGTAGRRRSPRASLRGDTLDVEPNFGTFGGLLREPGLRGRRPSAAAWRSSRSVDRLRARRQPLRRATTKTCSAIRRPAARPTWESVLLQADESRLRYDAGAVRCSAGRHARRCRAGAVVGRARARTARARRRCCACWPARCGRPRAACRSTAGRWPTTAARARAADRRRAAGDPAGLRLLGDGDGADGAPSASRASSSSRARTISPIARDALAATGTAHLEDRDFATLSGGEKQRVVIAAALAQAHRRAAARRADRVARSRRQLRSRRCSRELNRTRGVTIVVSTHDLNLAAGVCRDLVLLREGRVLAAGPTADVLTARTSARSTASRPTCTSTTAPAT